MNPVTPSTLERNRAEMESFLEERHKRLAPVATTRTPSGAIIDWVPRESQLGGAPLATPPPLPEIADWERKMLATPELSMAGVERGPKGTVPFRRPDVAQMSHVLSLAERAQVKVPPPDGILSREQNAKAAADFNALAVSPAPDYAGHYYGNSGQGVTNYGGKGSLSCFAPGVSSSSHFSLIQIGCSNSQQGYYQTVEAGWIVYPDQYGGSYLPHLFTFFTTNGYGTQGDDLGGWDAFQKGWVQVDANLHPGSTFSPLSSVDGQQKQITIQYQLRGGNWWFAAQGVWMGYYPASLFAKSPGANQPVSTVNTLGNHADSIGFWGEIYDKDFTPPATQMGSGDFAGDGFGWSAYLINLLAQTGAAGAATDFANYNGGAGSATDANLYTINTFPTNTDGWGSYMFVGGPGGGGGNASGSPACHAQLGLAQTDVFSINTRGELQVSWVDGSGGWNGPGPIGSTGLLSPLARLVSSPQYGLANQTDVFAIDTTGTLTVSWVTGGGGWSGPSRIGAAVLPAGAPLAAGPQFGLNQTDVFAIGNSGGLTVSWVTGGGGWSGPSPIGAAGLFAPGAGVATSQQFGLTQTDVFAVDKSGALRVAWVDGGGAWAGPAPITANGTFPSGAPVAAGQQIGLAQTDVFGIDSSGALVVVWVYEGGSWAGPMRLSPTGTFTPGSYVATSQQFGLNQTDVFVVDKTGALTVTWVTGGGGWSGPAQISAQSFALPGAPIAACQQVTLSQTNVFVMDRFGSLSMFWVYGGGAWQGPTHP